MRAAVVLVVLLGCRGEHKSEIQRAPERELPRAPPVPVSTAPTVQTLIGHAGEDVIVVGVVDPAARPRIPWSVAGKSPAMIDVAGSHLRIVAHAVERRSCPGEVLLRGQVIVARGLIKQGGTEGDWAEPQLDVTDWGCR